MFQKEIVINNKTGLHARPAAELVEFCSKFDCDISLLTEANEVIDAKSIVSVLSGGVNQGDKVLLQVDGFDEETAGLQIAEFLENLTD